jgi:glyoxylase-like metal-dependent hydrolase (beta-lactamase superfamily II)/rhodanese-related sulfurtransferase
VIFEQIVLRDLGCAAYVVGCQQSGEAVVVDPPLHVGPVLEACRRHGAELVGVIETHTHADHVSGHGTLALRHGAWIAAHPLAGATYDARPVVDGDVIELGEVALQILHTPGHRPEHCCVAVTDHTRTEEPWLLLTGDSLFVGDVARPDLAVDGAEGAEGLFHSLHERLAGLADGIEVYPGHVAGSLCGRGMSAKTSTTLGFERRFNPMLADLDLDGFVHKANADLAPRPPGMARIVELNRGAMRPDPPVAERQESMPEGAQLLDVREARRFAAGFARGALNVPVDTTGFANRAGFVLDPARVVALIADSGREAGAAARLLGAVGFDQLVELARGPDTAGLGDPAGLQPMALDEVAGSGLHILDVREPTEEPQPLDGAVQIPYRLLPDADLSGLDPAQPVVTVCGTGVRTSLAASILAARGFRDPRPVLDRGMTALGGRQLSKTSP